MERVIVFVRDSLGKSRRVELPLFGSLGEVMAFLPVVAVSMGYAIFTRTPKDFITYSGMIAAVIFVLLCLMRVSLAREYGKELPDGFPMRPLYFLNYLAIAVFQAPVVYCMAVALKDTYFWVLRTQHPVAILGLTLLAGYFLFQVRSKFRFVYGATEIGVGLLVATYRYPSATALLEPDVFLAYLTAGVYLVVRGFDNVKEGLGKNSVDRLVAWFRGKVPIWKDGLGVVSDADPIVYRRMRKKGERTTLLETMRRRILNSTKRGRS